MNELLKSAIGVLFDEGFDDEANAVKQLAKAAREAAQWLDDLGGTGCPQVDRERYQHAKALFDALQTTES